MRSYSLLVLPVTAAAIFACSDAETPTTTTTDAGSVTPEVDAGMMTMDASGSLNGSHVPTPSMMAAKLTAAGLDIKNLQPMDATIAATKNDPAKMKALMEAISSSLAVKCNFCHTASDGDGGIDFTAPSPKKKIATKMWDEFVVKLKFANNDPLFCDSCHAGTANLLDRDPGTISTFMGSSYVGQFARKDGMTHRCATCHGEPFSPEFIAGWAK